MPRMLRPRSRGSPARQWRVARARPPAPVVRRAARGTLLVVGLVLITRALVGLVDTHLAVSRAAPWWYLGVIGLVAVLLALGSPWSGRDPGD